MGWSSGADLLDEVVDIIKNLLDGDVTKEVAYERLIDKFRDHDCDSIDQTSHPELLAAYNRYFGLCEVCELNPCWCELRAAQQEERLKKEREEKEAGTTTMSPLFETEDKGVK